MSTLYSNQTRIFLAYLNPTRKFLKNDRIASSMYFSLFRKIAASLLAKTILIDTALASNPSKEQEFHPQRRKCRSMSKRNNSSERNTIGIVNGHLGVVGKNADVLYFNFAASLPCCSKDNVSLSKHQMPNAEEGTLSISIHNSTFKGKE